jgi:hypothetical protein
MKKFILSIIAVVCIQQIQAQLFNNSIPEKLVDNVTLGVGVSAFSFLGDIGGPQDGEVFNYMTPGFSVFAESRLTNSISASMNFDYANLQSADYERMREMQFQTKALHFAWGFQYHFDNDIIIPYKSKFAPYLSAGMGIVSFNPQDEAGYLLDPSKNFEKFALTLPVSAGIVYKLNSNLHFRLSSSLVFTNTDHIDNYSKQPNQSDFFSGHKDAFFKGSLSLSYNLNPYVNIFSGTSCSNVYLTAGWGTLTYLGDLNTEPKIANVSNFDNAFNYSISTRFNNYFGTSIEGVFGKVTVQDEFPNRSTKNMDFQSTIAHANMSFVYFFDNNLILPRRSSVSPFISAGPGFMLFNPRGDKMDVNNQAYYFWSENEIMDAPAGSANATPLERDGIYETNLDKSGLYKKSAMTLHAGIGVQVKLTKSLAITLQSKYLFTNTDLIDNFANLDDVSNRFFTGHNDGLWHNSIGISLNLSPSSCRNISVPMID